ncbi:MAG: transposase [Candidatus Omnitrophica bacterium]|nr:transposase [Candidatus Omnitrophota bacterium]MCK5590443.1 transposase [Candidatus Paceibacterota bacterium]
MPIRADVVSGRMYHVFTKSIAGFIVFNNDAEYDRMIYTLNYYKIMEIGYCYSDYIKHVGKTNSLKDKDQIVDIIAYCLMPTHLHFILKQNVDKGISLFMRKVLNSYSKYFNCKIKRRGPLWESRFKNGEIENDEQLMHLTRYVHLNPVTAGLVKTPEFWKYSSYNEYLNNAKEKMCNYSEVLDIDIGQYKEFVDSQADYQKELAHIKHLILR